MRKTILSLFVLALTVLGVQGVRADEPDVTRYETDASGLFNVRCNYYEATGEYVISLTGIATEAYQVWDETEKTYVDNPAVKDLVFPATVHAKFTSYNKTYGGDDLEDDFSYELDEAFFSSSDYKLVETITFVEGSVTAIPDRFYEANQTEVMTDMWESYEENDATVLREITFPNSLVSIGNSAFKGHINLEQITFGTGLRTIGDEAFKAVHEYTTGGGMGMDPGVDVWHSAVTELVLPESLEEIGASAFQGLSQVKSLTLYNAIQAIGDNAFDYTGIEELTADLLNVGLSGTSPFATCPIKKLIIPCDGNSKTFVASVPDHLMHGVSSQFDVEFVPKEGIGNKCEGYIFGYSCFEASGVKSINFLDEVDISPLGPSLDFGDSSFKNTYHFKTLDIAAIACAGNVTFGDYAFQYSALETLTLNNRTAFIGEYAFDGTNIRSLEIPQYIEPETNDEGITQISMRAFHNAQKLETVRILGSIGDIMEDPCLESYVFERCYALKTVELPASLEIISAGAFLESGLTSFTGGENLIGLGSSVFKGCSNLEKVDLSATQIFIIPSYTFQDCKKLSEIKFPANLDNVYGYAFQNTGLKEVAVPANDVSAFAFCDMPNLEKIRFTGDLFETVETDLLSGCENLISVDFGNAVTFKANCITACPSLEGLVIPAKAETIDKDAFVDVASNISSITFNSNALKDLKDEASSPFGYMLADLYFGENVKQIPAYAFCGMIITNSPELPSDMTIAASAFDGCTLDTLNWHYDRETYPFKKAAVIKLAFKDVKEIKKGLFADATIGNLYLDGVETIGESAFESSIITNYYLNSTLTIPASVKEIKEKAFKGVLCGHLVFEKGEGLTIGKDAFCLAKDDGAFTTIRSYYDKDHIPAADGGFNIVDEVVTFYAGSCDDVAAYAAAAGWKDLNIKTWNGISQYKYSFEIVGAKVERPIEYYGYAIYVNDQPLQVANPIDCSNKATLSFDSPCSSDMKLVKWADETTDPKKCEITLTSDTVIRIYVEEVEHDVNIALRNTAASDAVKLYIMDEDSEWEERTSGTTNSCSPAVIKVELLDTEHYTFNGWFDGTDDKANQIWDIEEYTMYNGMTLYADVTVNKYDLTVEKDMMICPDCDWQLDEMIVNEESDKYSIYKSLDYNSVVTVTAKGVEGAGYRYVLDYWADDAGNYVTNENPYVFNMPGHDVRLRPVMKAANKYSVTAKSADDAMGTVTMTPEAGAETEPGSGLYWEGSKIELSAAPKGMHSFFKKWNDGSMDNPHTITVRNAFEYVAEFEKDSFNITVKVEGIDAELVDIKGEGRYGYDDEVTLSYTLNDDHYTFTSWFGDKTYSQDVEFKFNAQKTVEVRIVFAPKDYTITVVASPAEGGTISGGGNAPYKANVILRAVASEGYVFNGWEDDKDAVAERTVEVLGDATYTALFVKETETGIEDMQADEVQTVKEVRNGTLYIIRGSKTYNALGTEIR